MDPRRHHPNPLSFANLFNLESMKNFRVPQSADDLQYRGESSPDESRSSQGHGATRDQYNGAANDRSPDLTRGRKRNMVESDASMRRDSDSNDEDDDFDTRISEEQYRAMLGEHAEKFRRVDFKDSSSVSASTRIAMPNRKRVSNETGISEREPSPRNFADDTNADFDAGNRFFSSLESSYLDIGEGVTYQMLPSYDELAISLKLPRLSDIRIEEHLLNGALDLRSLAAMVSTERRLDTRHRSSMGEPQPQYESLQARLKGLSTSNSDQKFSLRICNINLDPYSIPEGAAGRIRRSIMDESGTLQVYFVKVLEKGDTYEIIERSLPKKQVVEKAPFEIEEEERDKIAKVWINIVKKDIPKHQKIFSTYHKKQLAKRFSESCQREVKLKISRSLRIMRTAAVRTRKLSRDMAIFWKKVDKEQSELRKKEERDAAEALKREEEQREAKRQQQRLNFLLSQTELYSHFMGSKQSSQDAAASLPVEDESKAPEDGSAPLDNMQEEEDPEEAELKKEALRAAQVAVFKQKQKTEEFDNECLRLRVDGESVDQMNDPLTAGSSDRDLLNPSTMPVTSTVQTPEMFKGCLKEYQLKGLQWLVNCYEQGLNGILADEMGLGKTIQAMAFLAHLAEEKNIWGPFLVVAPASVLNNWVDEISRFCPDFKTLPYWGSLQDRSILKKNISVKRLYRRESSFHILITSYQLLVQDDKSLKRIKWQYMVLDEAQAIKSSSSARWRTLLEFSCRNRLLLTGTPVQNNMAELWALLHFIMPTLFDSHEQFSEWFSKGIESHAENGGTLNEHQLNRLHAVLKPFMLRRVKKDVISEMTGKTEITVHCKLSSRQQAFYRAIKDKISLAELFDGNRGHLNDKKILNLMNIVIQLRKVCNHPELFERNEGNTYFYFAEITNYHLPPRWNGDRNPEVLHYGGSRNPITYKVPKLVYQELVKNAEMPTSINQLGVHSEYFDRFFNIFSPSNIQQSIWHHCSCPEEFCGMSGTFGFTRLMNLSPSEVSFLGRCSLLEKLVFSVLRWDTQTIDETLNMFMDIEGDDLESNNLDRVKVRAVTKMLLLPTKSEASFIRSCATGGAPYQALFTSHQDRLKSNISLLRAAYGFIPPATAPPIDCHCCDRGFAYKINDDFHHPWTKKLFVGFARTSEFNGPGMPVHPHHLIEEIQPESPVSDPFFKLPYRIFGSAPPMQSFDPAKMLTDSGKLQTLDILLKRLRAENHRVLLFAQMTKMLNILEDYMNYRKYKYFRLDGSSSIMDRRDMVRDFQQRNDIFVFLLSTRAGGLGINLTAADTVIFYESDWNPTLDLQAMDRAHRLGQTKEVTVYRLICKETVEEKILQRASQKNTVQQLVMTGGHVQGDLLKPEDVVSLLLDDAQLEQKLKEIPIQAKERQKKTRAKGIRVDADGGASLEDFASANSQGAENELENSSKKKKSKSKKNNSSISHSRHNVGHEVDFPMEGDELSLSGNGEDQIHQPKPKRVKRATKSVNETLEPAFNSTSNAPTRNFSDYQ